MSAPWAPPPNPGGQNRRALRTIMQGWVQAQHIPGLSKVYRNLQMVEAFEFSQTGDTRFDCVAGIVVPRTSEDRAAYTGPEDPGGKDLFQTVGIGFKHMAVGLTSPDDWDDAQDDIDRIMDAFKDALRGRGRDLDRPDVYTSVGEWPRQGSISDEQEAPVFDVGAGTRTQWATLTFTAIQYLEAATAAAGP